MFEGKKNDDGKLKWHLLPSSIKDVVEVFNHGSVKYGDFNWMKGIKYSRLYNAIQRHLYAWFYNQEQNDKESNLHHLAHVVASCLMLLYFEKNMSYVEFDDREPRNAG